MDGLIGTQLGRSWKLVVIGTTAAGRAPVSRNSFDETTTAGRRPAYSRPTTATSSTHQISPCCGMRSITYSSLKLSPSVASQALISSWNSSQATVSSCNARHPSRIFV